MVAPIDIAHELIGAGISPVPVPYRQKRILIPGWQQLRITKQTAANYFATTPQNIGALNGAPSGDLIDVDLDTAEAVIVAPLFLPTATATFGRKSKLRSHYLYRCVAETKKFPDPVRDANGKQPMIVELRSTGTQTVMPGSTHESGEEIRWTDACRTPAEIDRKILLRKVQLIAASALLGKHWPGIGARHDAALALSGGLVRAGFSVEETATVVTAVCRAAQCADISTHTKSAHDTAKKFSAGAKVAGWPSLATIIDPKVVSTACDWLGVSNRDSDDGADAASEHTEGASAAASGSDDEWPEIVPLDSTGELPPFPVEALPPALRDWAQAMATSMQVPVDLPALLAISVVSACCAKKFEIEVRPGWVEPLNLYTAVAMAPGERKSAVIREAQRPVLAAERESAAAMVGTIATAISKKQIKERALKAAIDTAAKTGDGLDAHEAEELAVELASMKLPVAPRTFADDVTPEKLGCMMAEQGGRLALFSAEGGIIETIAGRYSEGVANLDLFLKAHPGDYYRADRIKREPVVIAAPALTVALTVQPDVIRGLAARSELRGRGLIGRFMYSMPKSLVGRRDTSPPPVPDSVRAAYDDLVQRLLALPETRDESDEIVPFRLRLDPEAQALFTKMAAELEPRLAPGADLEPIRDWATKHMGCLARIAGLLHLAEGILAIVGFSGSAKNDHERPNESILANVANVALKGSFLLPLSIYLVTHALAAYTLMGSDPLVAKARRILSWAEKKRLSTFTKRDVWRALRSEFEKAENLDKPLKMLEEHGYIRLETAPQKPKPGRKPSPLYSLSPSGHNGHNGQNAARSGNHAEKPLETNVPESIPNYPESKPGGGYRYRPRAGDAL